ncbi:MAG: right-handed parallel beta-helix repeat-containing protein [Planctomycetota bacterium]
MTRTNRLCLALLAALASLTTSVFADTLEVGPGKPHEIIETAYRDARPGDVIAIYPKADGKPYSLALKVQKYGITFRGVSKDGKRVHISGEGFVYTGSGKAPRAIFEFRKKADENTIENLLLSDARNKPGNAAGVRINQANKITIRNCEIRFCDMGVISNGDLESNTAADQRIFDSELHHNGSDRFRGGSHNLYLDGTSAWIRGCYIHDSTVGHNLKARTHLTRIEYCRFRDAAEREIDIVNSASTMPLGSNAIVLGCDIAKRRGTNGNQGVFFFGADTGKTQRNGTLYIVNSTVSTPYNAGLVVLKSRFPASKEAPGVFVEFYNNIIWADGKRGRGRRIAEAYGSGDTNKVTGRRNWFCFGYRPGANSRVDPRENVVGGVRDRPPFLDGPGRDFRMKSTEMFGGKAIPLADLKLPNFGGDPDDGKLRQFTAPLGCELRPEGAPDLGAYKIG